MLTMIGATFVGLHHPTRRPRPREQRTQPTRGLDSFPTPAPVPTTLEALEVAVLAEADTGPIPLPFYVEPGAETHGRHAAPVVPDTPDRG